MTTDEIIATIDAIRILPETDETRQSRNQLREMVCEKIKSSDNIEWLLMLFYQMRDRKGGAQ